MDGSLASWPNEVEPTSPGVEDLVDRRAKIRELRLHANRLERLVAASANLLATGDKPGRDRAGTLVEANEHTSMNRRCIRTLVALAVALLAGSVLAITPARSVDVRPEEVGRLPVWGPPNALLETSTSTVSLNPTSRRGYQLTVAGIGTQITAFDLDTLEPLQSRQVPDVITTLGADGVDTAGGRHYFNVGAPWFKGVAMLDEKLFAAGDPAAVKLFSAPSHPIYTGAAAVGIRYEPRINKLLIMLNPQRTGDSFLGLTRAKGPYANFLAQWNGDTGAQDWLHLIRECSTASVNFPEMGTVVTPFLSADGTNIYGMCATSESEMQMLRLAVPSPGAEPTGGQLFPAASSIFAVMVDPVAERVHMISGGAYMVTFDWKTRRVVGTASISPYLRGLPIAFGAVDPQTGRVIIASPPRDEGQANKVPDPGGLMLVDARRAVLPQALVYEHLADNKLHKDFAPVIDPAGPGRPRRVFMRHSVNGNVNAGRPYFRVVADPVPMSSDPPGGELDPTKDIDESDKTQSSFAGEANGYGTRVLTVGGIQSYLSGTLSEVGGQCSPTNREILFASNPRAAVSSVSTAARADGADADLSTQADLRDLSRCGNGGYSDKRYPEWPSQAQKQGPGWDYMAAECSGLSSKETGGAGESYTAIATCDQEKATANGKATHAHAAPAAAVTVARSFSETKVRRDPKLGVVAETTSVSEGIVIPGQGPVPSFSIASVKSVAMSRANGRTPKKGDPPRTTWTVEICGVTIGQVKDQACRSGDQAKEMIAQLNNAGRNRLIFRQPAVDKDLLAGSPGGYAAGIQRDRGEAALAKLENNDELMSVPGLEMIVRTNPDGNIKRHIVQFAGVRAVSTYGIFDLPDYLMSTEVAEETVEELGLVVDVDEGSVAAAPVAVAVAKASPPQGPVGTFRDAIERIVRTAFKFDLRNPGDVALALGVWLAFGTPLYLAERRRRYNGLLV